MKTNKILMAMALAAGFTACTSEDVVESTQNALNNRKVLGDIEFVMGDVDSRFTQTKDGWVFDGGDAFGACLVDTYNGNENADAWKNYTLSQYIQTNYQYAKGEGNVWTTPARMVEGNYVFYAPFNAKHLARTAMETAFPITQTLDVENGKVDPYSTINNAIAEGYPFFVDYKFLSAANQETSLAINFKHLYAYPEVKIVNDWEEDVTIEKIVIVTDAINAKGTLKIAGADATVASSNAGGIVGNLYNLGTESDNNAFGAWVEKDVVKGLAGATADVIADKGAAKTTHVVVEIPEGLTIKAEEEVVFNVVMPAAEYDNLMIYAMVDDEDGFASKAIDATFHPGKRYPFESYKPDGSLKTNPGKTFSLTIEDEAEPQADAIAPIIVSTTAELVNAIKAVEEDASLKVLVASEDVAYNQSVVDAIENSEMTGLTIDGDITIEGVATATEKVPNLPVANITINGVATVKNIVALGANVQINELVVASGANLTVAKDNVIAKATNNGTMKIAGAATVEKLINKSSLEIADQLTGEISNYKKVDSTVEYTGTVNVTGAYTTAATPFDGTWNVSGTLTVSASTLTSSMTIADGGTLKGGLLTVTGGTLSVNGTVENDIKLNGSPKIGDVAAVSAKVEANATSDFDGTITGTTCPEQNTLTIAEGAYFLKQTAAVASSQIKAIYTHVGNIADEDAYNEIKVPVQANWFKISGNVMHPATYNFCNTLEIDGDVKGNTGTFTFGGSNTSLVKIKNIKLEGSANVQSDDNLEVTGSVSLAAGTNLILGALNKVTLKNLTNAKADLDLSQITNLKLTGKIKALENANIIIPTNTVANAATFELGTSLLLLDGPASQRGQIHIEGAVTLASGVVSGTNLGAGGAGAGTAMTGADLNLYNGATLTIAKGAKIAGFSGMTVDFVQIDSSAYQNGTESTDGKKTGAVVNNGEIHYAAKAYSQAAEGATADTDTEKLWWTGNDAWVGATAPVAVAP